MEISEVKVDEITVVGLTGHLDGFSAPEAERCFFRILDEGEKRLVIDLSRLEYVSSLGLGLFVHIHKRMAAAGGRVCFCAPPEAVRQLFEVSNLQRLLTLKEEPAEALGWVKAG